MEEPIPKLGTECNSAEKISLTKQQKYNLNKMICCTSKSSFLTLLLKYSAAAFCSELISLPWNGSEQHSESLFLFLVAQTGIPSCVLCSERNPRICIYFDSTERNSELCSLQQKGSEQNYWSLLLFLFHRTEFRVVFSSAEGFGTECRDFLFRGTTGIP